jgi:taurine dioxygenase
MELVRLSDAVGYEAKGIDITEPLSDVDVEALRKAYEQGFAVLVRGQELTQDQMLRYCSYFWPVHRKADGTPHWTLITNRGEQKGRTGSGILLFHNDHSFAEWPNTGQVLYGHELSNEVAPTSFANTVRAAQQLPPELRQRLAHLESLHLIDFECMNGEVTYRTREADLPEDASTLRFPRWTHPMLLDEVNLGGAEALFVSEAYASHVTGVSPEESEQILAECFAILYAPDNVYEHHWQPHDILVWNNRALQHGRPKSVSASGVREFWRLKSFAKLEENPSGTKGSSALDLFPQYAVSKKSA